MKTLTTKVDRMCNIDFLSVFDIKLISGQLLSIKMDNFRRASLTVIIKMIVIGTHPLITM